MRSRTQLKPIAFALLPVAYRADRWWEVLLLGLGEVAVLALVGWGITATAGMRHPSSPAFFYSQIPLWQGITLNVMMISVVDCLLLVKRDRAQPVVLVGYLALGMVACLVYLAFDAIRDGFRRRHPAVDD
jgi:hypothetical protein